MAEGQNQTPYAPPTPLPLHDPGPDATAEQRLAYVNQELQVYKKREEESMNLRLAKAEDALAEAKKDKDDRAAKYFAIKTHGKTPSDYSGGTWHDWDIYVTEMESQLKQNNVDAISAEPVRSQRKIAYAETFLQKSPRSVWQNKQLQMKEDETLTWTEYKEFLLTHVDRYEHFQEDMQEKYKNLKQNATEKVKKYAERFDLVLARLETTRRRGHKGELQDFQEGLRNEYQIKLLEHRPYDNRRDLVEAVVRLESAEHRQKKDDKDKDKNKPKGTKRTSDNTDDSRADAKKPRTENNGKGVVRKTLRTTRKWMT